MKYFTNFHRFLMSQSFYPLVLSSMLAIGLYVGRVFLSSNWLTYRNLVWNLFLAWLPYLFSVLAAVMHRLFYKQWWLLPVPGVLWLVFFPNAPYIVTDFLHLEPRPSVPMWYDIALLAASAWTGIFLAVSSLRTMQWLIKTYLGRIISWFFVAVAMGLSGLGIYLGRFERWNSWDLLFHPRKILGDLVPRLTDPTGHLGFIGFTIIFTAFLLICYLMFISVHRINETEE